jgi:hypothetical protein
MERHTLYINLKEWIQNYHPELTQSKIEMVQEILEELQINEEDEIIISGDNQSWGFLCTYLIEKSRSGWD